MAVYLDILKAVGALSLIFEKNLLISHYIYFSSCWKNCFKFRRLTRRRSGLCNRQPFGKVFHKGWGWSNNVISIYTKTGHERKPENKEYIKIEIDSLMMPLLIKSHSLQLCLSDQLPSRSSSHLSKTGLAHLGMTYFARLCGLIPCSGWLTILLMVWRKLKLSFNTSLILCKLQILKNEKYTLNGVHFKQQSKHRLYIRNSKKYGRKPLYTDIENFQMPLCKESWQWRCFHQIVQWNVY